MDLNLFVLVLCTGFDLKQLSKTLLPVWTLTLNITLYITLFLSVSLAFHIILQENVIIIVDHSKYCWSKANWFQRLPGSPKHFKEELFALSDLLSISTIAIKGNIPINLNSLGSTSCRDSLKSNNNWWRMGRQKFAP